MTKLPLSESDYKKAVLLSDLLSKVREVSQKVAKDVRFIPEAGGYTVFFRMNGRSCRLRIKIG